MVTLGQLLRQQRVRKKVSIEVAATATKIKIHFLSALERGEYQKLPSPAYAKGFVLNYATYLGITKNEALALFKREFDEKRAYKVLPDSMVRKNEMPRRGIKMQESLVVAALVIIAILGYLLFQYRSAFFPPSLHITSPKEETVVNQEVTVTGKTVPEAAVTVNNEPVSLKSNGEFSKILTLFPGKTTITVKAKNSFGKETVVNREVVVK